MNYLVRHQIICLSKHWGWTSRSLHIRNMKSGYRKLIHTIFYWTKLAWEVCWWLCLDAVGFQLVNKLLALRSEFSWSKRIPWMCKLANKNRRERGRPLWMNHHVMVSPWGAYCLVNRTSDLTPYIHFAAAHCTIAKPALYLQTKLVSSCHFCRMNAK